MKKMSPWPLLATGPSCLWILLIALGGCAKTQAAIRHAAQCVTGLRLMRLRLRWGFYCSPNFSIRSRWISYVFVRRQEGTTAVPFPNLVQIFLEKICPYAKALPSSMIIFLAWLLCAFVSSSNASGLWLFLLLAVCSHGCPHRHLAQILEPFSQPHIYIIYIY